MKTQFLLLLFLLFAYSCSKDNEDPIDPLPVLEIEKEGVVFKVTPSNSILLDEVMNDQFGQKLLIRAAIDSGTFDLVVLNWDWQSPPENGVFVKTYPTNANFGRETGICKDTNNLTLCKAVGLSFKPARGKTLISEEVENTGQGEVVITANDRIAKTISGHFDAVVQEITPGIDRKQMTLKGTFANLPYQ